jgi:hypothetical protein
LPESLEKEQPARQQGQLARQEAQAQPELLLPLTLRIPLPQRELAQLRPLHATLPDGGLQP